MNKAHNLLVNIMTKEKEVVDNLEYNVKTELNDLKKSLLKIQDTERLNSDNNCKLVHTIRALDNLKDSIKLINMYINWYDEYIKEWEETKQVK